MRDDVAGSWRRAVMLAAAAALLITPLAASAAGTKVTADGDFVSTDQTGCILTEVAVFAGQNKGGKAKVALSITKVDECRGLELLNAKAKVNLKDGEFQYDPELKAATLNAAIEMADRQSRRNLAVDVQLTWVAAQDSVLADVTTDVDDSGRIIRLGRKARKTVRLADAYGTITAGTENFTPKPATDAAITDVE